jgi:NAD(P)-dependent dehydrogenase (short-subunit alcohol dehydrogenase family)
VQQAAETVQRAGAGVGGGAAGFTADLASLAAVRQLADDVRQRFPAIDVLVNNAGVYETQRKTSQAGRLPNRSPSHRATCRCLAPWVLVHAPFSLLGSALSERPG